MGHSACCSIPQMIMQTYDHTSHFTKYSTAHCRPAPRKGNTWHHHPRRHHPSKFSSSVASRIHDGHALLVELQLWCQLLFNNIHGRLSTLLNILHQFHQPIKIPCLGLVHPNDTLKVLILFAIPFVFLLEEIFLIGGDPCGETSAYLLHGSVH